ncbi:TadE/TadG family type IV pilus assembly protein [Zobellella iuensis]|uniref:Pilus assembly protein n=1 Tax=Zobellella iuensis TaxID=2803811 RepID=A0ABS1QUY6_9GAMM|nr:TadE family protein [Zobellella iuensis]MBL1378442.1 pilus assembly protein [Zobellella iuensis]
MKRLLSRQKGLAAVEATIVMPLLLLMLLAIAEFGRALYQYNTLTQAVRAGARAVSFSENPGNFELTAAMQARARNLILYGQEVPGEAPVLPGLSAADISFSTVAIPEGSTDLYVEIHTSYSWQPIFGLGFNTFFGGVISLDFPLETKITMRVLQ